jgi:hypothetical protein
MAKIPPGQHAPKPSSRRQRTVSNHAIRGMRPLDASQAAQTRQKVRVPQQRTGPGKETAGRENAIRERELIVARLLQSIAGTLTATAQLIQGQKTGARRAPPASSYRKSIAAALGQHGASILPSLVDELLAADNGSSGAGAGGGGAGATNIDNSFISQSEGGQRLDGYVPTDAQGTALGQSGVTVATGVDLGQMTQASLDKLNISQDLKDELSPYLGLRGQDAIDALNEDSLTLDTADANALDNAVHQGIYTAVANAFNNASDDTFASLPSAAQTAIADLAIQYGSNLAGRAPNFWSDVTEGRWQDAVDELRDFGDAYASRRDREADLLQGAINNRTLPSGN